VGLAVAVVILAAATQKGQTQAAEPGTLTCRALNVVDGNGNTVLNLGSPGTPRA